MNTPNKSNKLWRKSRGKTDKHFYQKAKLPAMGKPGSLTTRREFLTMFFPKTPKD